MARERDPRQVLREANQIAIDYDMRIQEIRLRGETVYQVSNAQDDKFLGRRSTPAGLRSLVARKAWGE